MALHIGAKVIHKNYMWGWSLYIERDSTVCIIMLEGF